ncbi:hypothetical protein GEV33_009458 [Tenebrio molitor]|uniref:Uncharacterized protein n=1 Tax=Tenebrio molitor TaxID=7067 RepID=A0A8J6L9M4_TENMO|nr:hypothetical protein GEV33_009458 [Tenebrio molitor]
MYKKGQRECWYLVAPEPFGDGVRDLEEGQDGGKKRESRGSLAIGGNGPGQREKARWPGFPRNGKERARKKKEKAGRPGFPRNGRERARKEKEKAGRLGFPRNGRERARKKKEKAGRPGFPHNGREWARKEKEKAGWPRFPRNGKERARGKRAGIVGRKKHGFRGGFGGRD